MDILFYAEAIIYAVINTLLGVKSEKTAIVCWRAGALISIFDVVLSVCFGRTLQNGIFAFLFPLQFFILVPLIPRDSLCCSSCGKRLYWKPLISNTCPHCAKSLY